MQDMKIKYDNTMGGVEASKDGYYPNLEIPGDMFSDKVVGDMCELKIKVKIIGIREDKQGIKTSVEVRGAEYGEEDDGDDEQMKYDKEEMKRASGMMKRMRKDNGD